MEPSAALLLRGGNRTFPSAAGTTALAVGIGGARAARSGGDLVRVAGRGDRDNVGGTSGIRVGIPPSLRAAVLGNVVEGREEFEVARELILGVELGRVHRAAGCLILSNQAIRAAGISPVCIDALAATVGLGAHIRSAVTSALLGVVSVLVVEANGGRWNSINTSSVCSPDSTGSVCIETALITGPGTVSVLGARASGVGRNDSDIAAALLLLSLVCFDFNELIEGLKR